MKVTTVPASYDTLFTQATTTVESYFNHAVQMTDAEFGKGFAKANPQLVGQLVTAMTRDFHASSFGKVIGELADVVRDQDFSGR
jgi:hypothetical protein